jgi:hypothetical protein
MGSMLRHSLGIDTVTPDFSQSHINHPYNFKT